MSRRTAKYNEEGKKICFQCGKPDGLVKFTTTKNVCNTCRGLNIVEESNSPENLYPIWKERNTAKASIFFKNKVDPCHKCNYDKCKYCVVFHMKKSYLHPKDPASKAFANDFIKNLLENIKRIKKDS